MRKQIENKLSAAFIKESLFVTQDTRSEVLNIVSDILNEFQINMAGLKGIHDLIFIPEVRDVDEKFAILINVEIDEMEIKNFNIILYKPKEERPESEVWRIISGATHFEETFSRN